MKLSELTKITKTQKKRGGQGEGSGRGKTAGRGTKGQNARSGVPIYFEGGALPLTKRLPFMRGKGRNDSFRATPVVVNIGMLQPLPKDSIVDIATLVKYNIVKQDQAERNGVKILADGAVTTSLTIALPISKSAKEKIEKAGGKIAEAH